MPCLLSKDQPLRVQLSKNGVIHAGAYSTWGGHHRNYTNKDGEWINEYIPERENVRIACSWNEISKNKIVPNKNKITCKNCIKKMGMDDSPVFPERYVVRRKDTGEFFKNTSSRCSVWSSDISDAWFYKRKVDADKQANAYHYVDDKGEKLRGNWYGQAYAKKRGWRRVDEPDPRYEVRKIKVTLFEEDTPTKKRR